MLSEVRNPVMRDYLRQYREIYDSFTEQVELFGLPFAPSGENEIAALRAELKHCGIEEGDTVKISSQYGETLRRAYVTSRLMPGVVGLPHGAWIRINEKTGIDRSGSENYLTGNVARGLGCSGYNTLNVEVTKFTLEEIPDDVEIPQTILFD